MQSDMDFVREVLMRSQHFQVSSDEWRKFSEVLNRPPQVKPRLKKLFAESTVLEQR